MDSVSDKPRRVLRRCDGLQLLDLAESATTWLVRHAASVDALNVYPVPDGDTGANMSQTMRAAYEAAAAVREVDAGKVAALLAHGALMGARGNSGVILSQLLRGFARAIDGQRTFSAIDLARALNEASATAYRAVMKPVEGTVLTVSKVVGQRALESAAERPEFLHVLASAVSAGRRAVAETTNQLPVLRQAGVVDAGAQGYVLILEGALRRLQGRTDLPAENAEEASRQSRALAEVHARFEHELTGFGYCTEFMIAGQDLDEIMVRETLNAYGDSLLVVGGGDLIRVHIHTDDPGKAMTYAGGLGRLQQVKVQDMQAQHDEFRAETKTSTSEARSLDTGAEHGNSTVVGAVAVATGDGFIDIFKSLGATVVPGGRTMNPSTQQILTAVHSCAQDTVVVLPNNGNVLLSARQAATLSEKMVRIVPTETMPQGIAAMLAVRHDEEIDDVVLAMRDACSHVRTLEITTAVRDTQVDDLSVRIGDVIGLVDGKLTVAGGDTEAVAGDMLESLPATSYELVTIYAGEGVKATETEALAAFVARRYPELAIEQQGGGQPHYRFVLSLE